MRNAILYTLDTDSGKVRRMAQAAPLPTDTHRVHLAAVPGAPATRRCLDDVTLDWLSTLARPVDILIWLGHGSEGRLSGHGAVGGGEGTSISLQDIVTTISLLQPRVVNFLACNFASPAESDWNLAALKGPYRAQNALRWISEQLCIVLPQHTVVLNGSTTTAIIPTSEYLWFSSHSLDVHYLVRAGEYSVATGAQVRAAVGN